MTENDSINVAVRSDEDGYYLAIVRNDGTVAYSAELRYPTSEEAITQASALRDTLTAFGAQSTNVGLN